MLRFRRFDRSGLAFDRSGARIGYGKGFCDRYLGKIPAADRPYLVGLCFPCQLFEILDGQNRMISTWIGDCSYRTTIKEGTL